VPLAHWNRRAAATRQLRSQPSGGRGWEGLDQRSRLTWLHSGSQSEQPPLLCCGPLAPDLPRLGAASRTRQSKRSVGPDHVPQVRAFGVRAPLRRVRGVTAAI
jgi:hypothetical protein